MQEQVDMQVSGMSCSGCERRIDNALARLDGVRQSGADHRTGRVRVAFDPAEVSVAAVRARIEQLGYAVVGPGEGR